MNDTNYIGGIIKILEPPKQKVLENNILVTKIRGQISQLRKTRLVTLTFWGNLARDVTTYYKVNDYVIVEGYLSLREKNNSKSRRLKSKRVHITVRKVYPFLLSYDRSVSKI